MINKLIKSLALLLCVSSANAQISEVSTNLEFIGGAEIISTILNNTTVNVLTVPQGVHYLLTDLIISNSNTGASCCAQILGDDTVRTGPIVVPAQDTVVKNFMTGIGFTSGTTIRLRNDDNAGPLDFTLRGYRFNNNEDGASADESTDEGTTDEGTDEGAADEDADNNFPPLVNLVDDQGLPAYKILRASKRPKIDGDISEFEHLKPLSIKLQNGSRGQFWLLWDDEAIYFAARVRDRALKGGEVTERDGGKGSIFRDDSISFQFDTANRAGKERDENDYGFGVTVLNVQQDEKYRNDEVKEKPKPMKDFDVRFSSATTRNGTLNDNSDRDVGWTLEVRIRWEDWGVNKPSHGTDWGLQVQLNDHDKNGHNIGRWRDRYHWGDGVFSAQIALPAP